MKYGSLGYVSERRMGAEGGFLCRCAGYQYDGTIAWMVAENDVMPKPCNARHTTVIKLYVIKILGGNKQNESNSQNSRDV